MEQSKINTIVELMDERKHLLAEEKSYVCLKTKAEELMYNARCNECVKDRFPYECYRGMGLSYVKLVIKDVNSCEVELTHREFFDLLQYAQQKITDRLADINQQLEAL